MIERKDYLEYFGVGTAPENFKRLVYLSLNELKSIMTESIPETTDLIYKEFQNALLEQVKFFELNEDLIDSTGSSGYTLGSYSENSSNQKDTTKSIQRISPIAYDILLNCGLLYSGLKGRC